MERVILGSLHHPITGRVRVTEGQNRAEFGQSRLELMTGGAVDEKVAGEVEHHQQVRHALQTHDPQGRDIAVRVFDAFNLLVWNGYHNYVLSYLSLDILKIVSNIDIKGKDEFHVIILQSQTNLFIHST